MDDERCAKGFVLGLTLAVAGCNPMAAMPPEQGQAVVRLQPSRQVQYSVAQVKATYLTLNGIGNSRSFSHTYGPLALSGPFQFSALNLPVGQYSATLAAYYNTATSSATLMGSTATDSFTVTQGTTRTVVFPPISLTPTPTASWPLQVTINVSNPNNTFSSASASVKEVWGRQAAGPTWSTTSKTIVWKNLQAFPGGISTTSITATRTGNGNTTKTVEATASLVPGMNATTSVTISL